MEELAWGPHWPFLTGLLNVQRVHDCIGISIVTSKRLQILFNGFTLLCPLCSSVQCQFCFSKALLCTDLSNSYKDFRQNYNANTIVLNHSRIVQLNHHEFACDDETCVVQQLQLFENDLPVWLLMLSTSSQLKVYQDISNKLVIDNDCYRELWRMS